MKRKRSRILSFRVSNPNAVNRSACGTFAIFLILLIAAMFMALPLVYIASNAFKPLDEIFAFPPKFFVRHPTIQNFIDLMNILNSSWVPFTRYLFNTVFTTVVGTVGNVICSSLCAFVLAKHDFPGKEFIFKIVVLSLMFSSAVTVVPNYITMFQLDWIDTYNAVIVPAFQMSLGLYLMKQFMEGVPDVLMESARVEGASEIIILVKIIMPCVKPAWLTLSILSIQTLWNQNSLYIYDESYKGLSQAMGQVAAGGIARTGATSAVGLAMIIVPIVVFLLSQSQIIETMSSSGMKE